MFQQIVDKVMMDFAYLITANNLNHEGVYLYNKTLQDKSKNFFKQDDLLQAQMLQEEIANTLPINFPLLYASLINAQNQDQLINAVDAIKEQFDYLKSIGLKIEINESEAFNVFKLVLDRSLGRKISAKVLVYFTNKQNS